LRLVKVPFYTMHFEWSKLSHNSHNTRKETYLFWVRINQTHKIRSLWATVKEELIKTISLYLTQCMTPMHFWILYFHSYDTQLSKCENLNSFFGFINSGVVIDLFDYSKHITKLCIRSNSRCANNIWCNILFSWILIKFWL
jgi:hypothetical protein